MCMSNLRELLQNVCNHDKNISQPAYALLKALVKAIDGGEHTYEECKFFSPYCVDAFACRDTPYFGGRRTTSMRTICDEFQAKSPISETGFVEARAEIEKLNAHIAELVAQHIEDEKHIVRLHQQCTTAWKNLDLDEVSTNAEIGRMVREMRDRAGLRYVDRRYRATMYSLKLNRWLTVAASCYVDPAEALRAIQKEGT